MNVPPPGAEQLARDLAKEMPSPYCPGRSISSCPSEMARKLEDDILEAAAQGQTKEQIEQTLVARFGREKMGYAQSNAVFIFVTVAAVLAVGALFLAARRWARRQGADEAVVSPGAGPAAEPASAVGAPTADELDDLEEALDALDRL